MLREFTQLKQEVTTEGKRRWFESDGFDLVVWFDVQGEVNGFQVCYDFGSGEHAFTWRIDGGYSHSAIDSGDATPFKNEAPILIPDGAVPWTNLRRSFEERSGHLDSRLREFVREKLRSCSDMK